LRRDNDILVTSPWQASNPVRWGAVIAGAVIAAGVMALLTSLWLALAYDTKMALVANNLGLWIAASAIVAMLLAGLLAGGFASARGPGAGFVNGMTVWGLLVVLMLAVGAPLLRLFNLSQVGPLVRNNHIARQSLWSAFVALLLSWAAATIGGTLGGATHRDDGYTFVEEEEPAPSPPPARHDALNGDFPDRDRTPRDPLGTDPYRSYGGYGSQ